jgi:hypothetical protein
MQAKISPSKNLHMEIDLVSLVDKNGAGHVPWNESKVHELSIALYLAFHYLSKCRHWHNFIKHYI